MSEPTFVGGKLADEQINKLCTLLLGTTDSLDRGLEQIEARLHDEPLTEDCLTIETLRKIDDQIFCCVQCGWWCGVEEESEIASCNSNLVCRECGADDEEKDE